MTAQTVENAMARLSGLRLLIGVDCITMNVILVVLIAMLSGCSLFVEPEQMLRVRCSPSGAIVSFDGKPFPCPQEIRVLRDKDIHIRIHKEGYYPYEVYVRKTLSGYGIGDAISTIFLLVPSIGLLSPGAYELMQTDFNIQLIKQPTLSKEAL